MEWSNSLWLLNTSLELKAFRFISLWIFFFWSLLSWIPFHGIELLDVGANNSNRKGKMMEKPHWKCTDNWMLMQNISTLNRIAVCIVRHFSFVGIRLPIADRRLQSPKSCMCLCVCICNTYWLLVISFRSSYWSIWNWYKDPIVLGIINTVFKFCFCNFAENEVHPISFVDKHCNERGNSRRKKNVTSAQRSNFERMANIILLVCIDDRE